MSIEKNLPNYLRHVSGGFTVVINETISLIKDAASLGIYVYLSSKPENWIVQEKDICSRFSIGRDSVRKRLNHLRECGLYEKIPIKGPDGRIVSWCTNLYATPKIKDLDHITDFQESGENHITENPVTGKSSDWKTPPLNNKRNINNKRLNKKEIISSPSDDVGVSDDDLFNRFWEAYPKKLDKEAARKAWVKNKTSMYFDTIMRDIQNRKSNHAQWHDKQYIPYPATYLAGKRWEDEIIPVSTQVKQSYPKQSEVVRPQLRDWTTERINREARQAHERTQDTTDGEDRDNARGGGVRSLKEMFS